MEDGIGNREIRFKAEYSHVSKFMEEREQPRVLLEIAGRKFEGEFSGYRMLQDGSVEVDFYGKEVTQEDQPKQP